MADENANDEAAVLDPALEGNGALETETFVEGDNANLEPAGVLPPGTEEQELTIEELREMSKRLDAGLPLVDEKPKTELEKDTPDDDEDEPKPKAAEGPKGKRIRTTIDHLDDEDQKAIKAVLDLTRNSKKLGEAVAEVFKTQAKADERAPEQQEEQQPQQDDPIKAIDDALQKAKLERKEARWSRFDAEAEEQAQDEIDRLNSVRAELVFERKLTERENQHTAQSMTQQAEAEAAQVRVAIPQLADPDDLLTLAYNRIVEKTPEEKLGPGSAMQIAEQAWKKVYPGKPFPANGAARQPARIVQPPQNGRPAAALATDGGTRTTVADFLKNPDAQSKEELLAIAAQL